MLSPSVRRSCSVWPFFVEHHVNFELAFIDLRIDLRDPHLEVTVVVRRDGSLSNIDTAEIELVDPHVEFVSVGVVDLSQAATAYDGLADLDVEAGEFAGDGCAHVQVIKVLARGSFPAGCRPSAIA